MFVESAISFSWDPSKKIIGAPANQSLKLTEPAVDDFAARQKTFFREIAMPAARVSYMELAARRRSLAPVR